MDYLKKLIHAIEIHSVEGIKACFENGINPNDFYRNEPLIYELTSEYTRTSRFKDCVRVFMAYGLKFDDSALLAVLSDDADALEAHVKIHPETVTRRYMLRCAYTPLQEATLLHICAEFNHLSCAEVLVRHGADIDAKAGVDAYGFGGQTPVFHTVNQNSNHSIPYLASECVSKSTNRWNYAFIRYYVENGIIQCHSLATAYRSVSRQRSCNDHVNLRYSRSNLRIHCGAETKRLEKIIGLFFLGTRGIDCCWSLHLNC